jgi:hypothetical protein
MEIKAGTYKGNGTSQNITGIGFRSKLVIIFSKDGNGKQTWKVDSISDTTSFVGAQTSTISNGITSINANGFSVGSYDGVNQNEIDYYYLAIGDDGNGDIFTGSYVGNDTTNRTITDSDMGFTGNFVLLQGAGITGKWKVSSVNTTYDFYEDGNHNWITEFVTNGFKLGWNTLNQNGVTYYYCILKIVSNLFSVGTFKGNGTDDRNITGPGFQPSAMVWVCGYLYPVNYQSRFKHKEFEDQDITFDGSKSGHDNNIQLILSTGFQIGDDTHINKSFTPYGYAVFKEGSTPITEITEQIKTVLESVSGIGRVWNRVRRVVTDAEERRLFHKNGKLHTWMIESPSSSILHYVSSELILRQHHYTLWGLYALDDSAGSEKIFQNLCDTIMDEFETDTNRRLNDLGMLTGATNLEEMTHILFGPNKTLCHRAKITLIVDEEVEV